MPASQQLIPLLYCPSFMLHQSISYIQSESFKQITFFVLCNPTGPCKKEGSSE